MSTLLNTLSNVATPGTWFTPAKLVFVVDCDAGEIVIDVRRGSGDAVPKMLSLKPDGSAVTLSAGRTIVIDNPVDGRDYRLRTATSGAAATAVATEAA